MALTDENRIIDGTTLNGVLVQIFDESHVQIGDDLGFMFEVPGPGRTICITITCDGTASDATCMGTLNDSTTAPDCAAGPVDGDTGADSGTGG